MSLALGGTLPDMKEPIVLEIEVEPGSPFAGKALRETGIRRETGCTILAVKQGATGKFLSNPPSDTLLQPGDVLIVLGTPGQLRRLMSLAGDKPPRA